MSGARPRIALIGCGGTISTLAADPRDHTDYVDTGRKIGLAELLDHVPGLGALADLRLLDMPSVSSSAMGPAQWALLRGHCRELAQECTGIVILHGTGTLEETAWALHLTLDLPVPVVLTGAQRPLSFAGGDAGPNLRDAVIAAGAGQLAGVTVCLAGQIHAARPVRKLDTYALSAFESPGSGPLGTVAGGRLQLMRPAPGGGALAQWSGQALPRVDLIPCHAGGDDALIRASLAAGARGLVAMGFAPGLTTPQQRQALAKAADRGVIVVQASRAISGPVAGRPGLIRDGLLPSGDLDPWKARILLALCLATEPDPVAAFIRIRDA